MTGPDAGRLLGQLADALNALERAGIIIDAPADAVMTSHGYVLPVGDGRLGARWQARTRLAVPFPQEDAPGLAPVFRPARYQETTGAAGC